MTAPIHRAAAKGDVEVLRLELDGGTDVDLANEEGWTALHHSIAQGHLPASKLLLQSLQKGTRPLPTAVAGEVSPPGTWGSCCCAGGYPPSLEKPLVLLLRPARRRSLKS